VRIEHVVQEHPSASTASVRIGLIDHVGMNDEEAGLPGGTSRSARHTVEHLRIGTPKRKCRETFRFAASPEWLGD